MKLKLYLRRPTPADVKKHFENKQKETSHGMVWKMFLTPSVIQFSVALLLPVGLEAVLSSSPPSLTLSTSSPRAFHPPFPASVKTLFVFVWSTMFFLWFLCGTKNTKEMKEVLTGAEGFIYSTLSRQNIGSQSRESRVQMMWAFLKANIR